MEKIEFFDILKTYRGAVVYQPLPSEPDFLTLDFYDLIGTKKLARIPQDPETDPLRIAEELKKKFSGNDKILILVPGKEFDRFGTRHGRGKGWYDRLLSALPQKWTRVGICHQHQLYVKKLVRQSWDMPMDWLIVVEPNQKDYQIVKMIDPSAAEV